MAKERIQRAINRNFTDRYDFRYTLIAATDINAFVPGACELVRRKRNSADPDPDSGTVDGERFEHWVRFNLEPTLGNYFHGEPRSIVVMDNASTHSSPEVLNLIRNCGALLLFQSTYSPDLNPIEFAFHQYKSHLKRNSRRYFADPYLAHFKALATVTKANMEKYYRKVGGIRMPPAEAAVTDYNNHQDATLCLPPFFRHFKYKIV